MKDYGIEIRLIIGNQAIIMMALAAIIEDEGIRETLKKRAEELVGLTK